MEPDELTKAALEKAEAAYAWLKVAEREAWNLSQQVRMAKARYEVIMLEENQAWIRVVEARNLLVTARADAGLPLQENAVHPMDHPQEKT